MCGDRFLLSTANGAGSAKIKAIKIACGVAAGILLLAGLGYYAHIAQRAHGPSSAANLFDRLTKKPHSIPVSSRSFTINQLGYTYFKVPVPAKASSVLLHGNFIANGGSDNTIEAFVFSENDYANWQNQRVSSPYYSSGKVTMDPIDAKLPPGGGSYYLVFNNKFSTLNPKTIRVDAKLSYYQ
jgi:hypothetical protein